MRKTFTITGAEKQIDEIQQLLIDLSGPRNYTIEEIPQPTIQQPEQYILLPENNQHPNLLIPQELSYQGKNFQSCYGSLQPDSFMLSIPLFIEFLNHLKSRNVHNANNQQLPQQRIEQILDNILTQRDPYRAEWLNAQFSQSQITYPKFINNQLQQVTEPLEDCLMQDKIPGINLDYWLQNATPQGLPPENTPDGDLYFWYPRPNAVAGFYADACGVDLNCNAHPTFTNSGLGVRVARIL